MTTSSLAVEDKRRRRLPRPGRAAAPRDARLPSPPPGRSAAAPASCARAAATSSPNWRSISAASRGGKSSEISRVACSRGVPPWSTSRAQTSGAAATASGPPGSVAISARRRPGPARARPAAGRRSRPSTSRRPAARSIPSSSSSASRSAAIRSIVSSRRPSSRAAEPAVVGADQPAGAAELGEEGRVPVGAGRRVAVDQQQAARAECAGGRGRLTRRRRSGRSEPTFRTAWGRSLPAESSATRAAPRAFGVGDRLPRFDQAAPRPAGRPRKEPSAARVDVQDDGLAEHAFEA